MDFNILDYGAVEGGEIFNTKAIQNAIDACSKEGGRVVIPKGKFMTATLVLKSGVDLHIETGGILLGSPNCEDYPEHTTAKHVDISLLPRYRSGCLIFADEATDISISGNGTIDCNGLSFVRKTEGYHLGWKYERIDAPTPPRVVLFTGCRNVNISGISMVNQPSGWSYWVHDCDYVTFDKLKILAEVQFPNNDGIHINSCRNVTVSNCSITTGDDCIIIRANNVSLKENKVCERVTVTNCNLTSYACGIRFGWLNDGTIRNCAISNVVITDSNIGIAFKLPSHDPNEKWADEGREATLIENIVIDNVIMDEIYCSPISMLIADARMVLCEGIRNIHFSNVHARGLELPRFIGRKNTPIENITLSNCSFETVPEETYRDCSEHGACWERQCKCNIFSNTKNISLNNTTFTVV